ncbi:pyridoxal-phosphate dependent enzyme [Gallaecimonas sp. GXIMD4217]|uniref:1-aminocyclopropane-1-carboxylate deaminase/D-cysteine desulfhydrase n=1 Tax=Gallaecimonas sp. GXIMD4217 TaxID=3131927 RepID=UPI00311AC9F1
MPYGQLMLPSPLQRLLHPELARRGVTLRVKRDDLIHPLVSGNKWRKLKYSLARAREDGRAGILSFGGAFSNHLHALAAACEGAGLACHGVVRGEPAYADNPTLSACRARGMGLSFVGREQYRQRREPDWLAQWQARFPDHLLVPEGGSNALALRGVAELLDELPEWREIWLPVGSGGTLAGLVQGAGGHGRLLGVPVVRDDLQARVSALLELDPGNWSLLWGHEGPGYGRFDAGLRAQILWLERELAIPLEPIYSGKLFAAFWQRLLAGELDGKDIILVHTGGLQGLAGLRSRGLWP